MVKPGPKPRHNIVITTSSGRLHVSSMDEDQCRELVKAVANGGSSQWVSFIAKDGNLIVLRVSQVEAIEGLPEAVVYLVWPNVKHPAEV